ncbi:MAG: right-handed parallel beta-helix repeat-containing protein [Luteimonas sp.]
MRLELAPGARLLAIPNGERRAYVLYAFKVADVEITGGSIVGDRGAHKVETGEWGHGIQLRGASRVTVRDIRITDCWGDGICIGGADTKQQTPSDDIVISNVVCRGNRRQGLSIGRSRNVRVLNSEFSDTEGTSPQYGIDIEPDRPGGTDNVLIQNCVIRGNRGGGVQIFRRVTNVTIRGCTIEDNRGRGILAIGAGQGQIVDNVIRNNGLVGVALRDATREFQVNGNRFSGNGARNPGKALGRLNSSDSAVRAGQDTQSILITGNQYQ